MVLLVRCDVDIYTLTASAQSISREVYDLNNWKIKNDPPSAVTIL